MKNSYVFLAREKKNILKIKNGQPYDALVKGDVPLYGSGGLMGFVDKSLFVDESVLLPRKGTLDNIMYVNSPFWTVDTMYWTEIDKSAVDPYYLYNYLKSLDLSPLRSGSTLPSMTFDAYYNIDLMIHPLAEQKKISKFLKLFFKKIELNNQIITELESLTKLIYEYWFIQFDFPDENGRPYKSSGGKMVWNEKLKKEIPEEWRVQTLLDNDISEMVSGGVESYEGKKEYLATANIDENGALNGDLLSFQERPNRANMTPVRNSIWVAKMADSTKRLFFTEESGLIDKYIISTGMFAFTSSKEHYEYLMMYLFDDLFEKQKDMYAQGATQRAINQANLSLFSMLIPEQEVLKQFHILAKDIVRKIELLKEENQKLKKLRDFLLPLLMNGQVTINE